MPHFYSSLSLLPDSFILYSLFLVTDPSLNQLKTSSEAVGEAFLSSVFQVIRERLASRDFRDYFHERVGKKLEIILDSINQVLDDAETKQYQMQNVKKWLDDLKYEAFY
ncbi:hypothetical protein TSUD_120200 [Trifolium subterraneum]|uniref:Disease resistance N-terminal domain-containing protein n=1 Tax=Trifolium subterraneum TaxID=3900 RepID=A0A2Z6ME19_TRISU|nr:hypothetical protein TSUD_120200 [Trifolium subterraneum]